MKGKNKSRNRCGFTLIELLIVLTIIGIVISMVAINYSKTICDFRDFQCLHRIKDLDSRGRQLAVANRKPYLLVIDGIRHRAVLANNSGDIQSSFSWSGKRKIFLKVENQENASSDVLRIWFNPQGLSRPYTVSMNSSANPIPDLKQKVITFYGTGQAESIQSKIKKSSQ